MLRRQSRTGSFGMTPLACPARYSGVRIFLDHPRTRPPRESPI